MSVILGLDPGLTSTGYGLVESDGRTYRHLHHGVIRTDPDRSRQQRLLQIYDTLEALVKEHQPAEAALETIYLAKNVNTALPVAEARGVILLCLAERSVPCGEYTPLEIKKAVVGSGRAPKGQLGRMVRLLLRLEKDPSPDHAADALAAAICHSNHMLYRASTAEGWTGHV